MARPIAAEYQERRARIGAAAIAVFARDGYHRASIGQIAETAGISKSLIYHYFPGKKEILAETLKAHVDALVTLAEEAAARHKMPEAALEEAIASFIAVYETAGATHRLLLNDLDVLDPADRDAIRQMERRIVHIFADLASTLAPADLASRKAASAAAMLLMGSMNFTHHWFHADGPVGPGVLAALVHRIFSAGFKALDDTAFRESKES